MKMKLDHGFTKAFGTFMEKLREIVKRETAGQVGPSGPCAWDVTYEEGYKYIRVILVNKTGDQTSKTAWGFIEKHTGDIFRAASWKAPCLNHTRGRIYDEDNGIKYARWTGPAYIWEIDEKERNRTPILSSTVKVVEKKEVQEEAPDKNVISLPNRNPPHPPAQKDGNMSIAAQIAAHIAKMEGKIA
jgi:hypothetical protein